MRGSASSPPNNRTLEKLLETAERSGSLSLVNRRLKQIGQLVHKHNFANLTEVNLSRNRLNEIPPEVFEWRCVSTLILSHNTIKSISEGIAELKLLETLKMNNNNLTVLPIQFCNLLHLTIVKLSNNKLISLPEEISRLKNCQELDVSVNELTSIPKEIAKMPSLMNLNISRNNIFALPEEIATMQLTHLDASCNLISTIPIKFRTMTAVRSLILHNNPLTSPQLTVLRKGRVHLFRELEIQAEKAQIKKDVMEDPVMSPMKRSNSVRSDVNLIEMNARALSIAEEKEGEAEERLEKAAELVKDRRKGSVSSTEKKNPSPKKRVEKPSPKHQKSVETVTSPKSKTVSPPRAKPKPPAKTVVPRERKRSASSGNFERKSSTEALLIHQKLSGFPGYKPNSEKSDPKPNGKPHPGDNTKDKLQEFVKNRHALSPTDRNNQVTNNKPSVTTTHAKKTGFLPSAIKPRSANRLRGNSFNSGNEKDGPFTVRRKTEKLYEELELMENVRQNVESRLKITLGDDLAAALSDGVVLCHLVNHARQRSISMIHVPSPAVPKLTLAKRRRNIDNFLEACLKIGVPQSHICSAQDILLEKNMSKVAGTVLELLKLCPAHALSPKRQVETPTVKVAPSTLKQQSAV